MVRFVVLLSSMNLGTWSALIFMTTVYFTNGTDIVVVFYHVDKSLLLGEVGTYFFSKPFILTIRS